jgi:trk system potassium uptake protein
MNFGYILNIEGKIMIIISLFVLTIFPWIHHFQETMLYTPVLISFLFPFLLGLIMIRLSRKASHVFHIKEAYFLVSISWITMGLAGSLPFYFSGAIPSFIDAVFESISGFTTTGSSILTDIESLPYSVLYWRSLTHWIGGMGIIVLVVAVLPNLNIAGYQLFAAEMSGGISSERIKPRVKDIAKRLWLIYFLLTLLVVILLMADNLSFFESLCHSFGTVATGGFSTKNASVGAYSPYVQYIITVFMILSGINFSLHYYALKGNFKRIKADSELKAYLGIIVSFSLVIAGILMYYHDQPVEQAFRESFFQVASIITATGFATADYLQWKGFAWYLIFLLMFVGACVASTGGGIKVVRHVVAWKFITRNFLSLVHPQVVKHIRINNCSITDEKAVSVIAFMAMYLFIVAFSTLFINFLGMDIETSAGSVLATIGGIGPGIGLVGPAGNFSMIPDIGKVYLSFVMILGRLEILTFLVLLTPGFWKK